MPQLRTVSLLLIALVVAVSIGCGYFLAKRGRQQREIVEQLRDVGCTVSYLVPAELTDESHLIHDAPGPLWWRSFLGDHFFCDGMVVELPAHFGQTIRHENGCHVGLMSFGSYDDIHEIRKLQRLELICVGPGVPQGVINQLRRDLPEVAIQVDQDR